MLSVGSYAHRTLPAGSRNLTEETAQLFDQEAFHAIKESAILINTFPGAIVDIAALSAAIRDGEITEAGLDVLPISHRANEIWNRSNSSS